MTRVWSADVIADSCAGAASGEIQIDLPSAGDYFFVVDTAPSRRLHLRSHGLGEPGQCIADPYQSNARTPRSYWIAST